MDIPSLCRYNKILAAKPNRKILSVDCSIMATGTHDGPARIISCNFFRLLEWEKCVPLKSSDNCYIKFCISQALIVRLVSCDHVLQIKRYTGINLEKLTLRFTENVSVSLKNEEIVVLTNTPLKHLKSFDITAANSLHPPFLPFIH